MADETGIINGSFKGVPISIDSGSVDGGRKISVKQFPNRDTQNVEDLGLQPRRYSVEIVVSAKQTQDYFSYRNGLIAALESKGPGELIHPLYGRIDSVVAVSYSLNESFGSFGNTTVSVNFEVQNNTGIPQSAGNAVTNVQALNTAVSQAMQADISENFSVDTRNAGNFQAAADKVDGMIQQAAQATEFIGEAADTLNEFSAEIGRLSAAVNSLVSDPEQLATETVGLFESVEGLYASADATFETFVDFFGFGSDDTLFSQNTAGLLERKKNNDVINGAVAASALGYAYLSATQLDFQTTLGIDEVAAQLDDQYAAVQASGADQSVKDAVTDMRVTVLDVFDQARVSASQIITVETLPTTTRLLAFSYYGNDESGETITDLNEIADVSFIEGPVEVLTA